jgi:hypothetical protein
MFRIKGIVVIRDNQPYKLPDITATSYGDAMHQLEDEMNTVLYR